MTISTIIPIYNSEKYLQRCIESVLAARIQEVGNEIILVNDGSTDASLEICEKYATTYSNIKVFSQENKGSSAARNYGLDKAQGNWITFVDSDDYVEKNYFEEINSNYKKYSQAEIFIYGYYKDKNKLKKEFNPDLVFFTTPWNHSLPQYLITNFENTLTGYVPYGFKNSNLYKEHFNRRMQNYCWAFFLETEIHKKLTKKYSYRKGENAIVTGFPGIDVFLDKSYKPQLVWKEQSQPKKKIIWAPHHTIDGIVERNLLNYSTFLNYAELMFQIAEDFQDEIQIAFKPHPNLKGKLNQLWGKEKTNNYYKKWKDLPNGQLEEGSYVDLFLTSDAMIHDSGSFLIEYLFTYKPVLYLINNEKSKEQYNELGEKALTKIPLGYKEDDVLSFIKETVLKEKDEYRERREKFLKDYLLPPKNKLASENIYEYLLESLRVNLDEK